MKKYILIDLYECNGCGSCAEICPEVFFIDENSEKAALFDPEAEVTEKVEEAVAYCPQNCISIS